MIENQSASTLLFSTSLAFATDLLKKLLTMIINRIESVSVCFIARTQAKPIYCPEQDEYTIVFYRRVASSLYRL